MRYREILEACWKGYRKDGMKTMFGKRYPNCVKNKKKSNESVAEDKNSVNEIDFSSSLGDLSISDAEIINDSSSDGTIGSREVFLYEHGQDKIYFFTDKSKISALLYLSNGRLAAIKNFSKNRGLIYNLFQHVINGKKQKITLASTDRLTHDGIKWIIGQIKRKNGFKISDKSGNKINADTLYGEWENSRNSGESGPTEIVISESSNSVQIRENEQRIMPMDIFGATLKTTNNSQHNIGNLLENDGAYDTLAENLRDWFGKGKDGGAGGGGWDRYNTKGERIGKCGDRKPGEGKPKCLSKSAAAKLRSSGGKKKIATAVKRKKSADKNPERKGKAKNVSSAAESVMEAAVTKLIPYTPEEIRRYNRWAERNGQSDYNPQHLFRGSVGDKMMFVGKGTPIPVEVIRLDQSHPTAVAVRTIDGSNTEHELDWINYRDQVQLRPMTPQEQSMHANELRGELAETNESDSQKQNFDTANIWASNFIAHGQEMREILDIPNDSTVYFGDLPEVIQNEIQRQIDGQVEDGERVTIRQRGRNIRDARVIVEVPHLDAIDETTMTQATSRSAGPKFGGYYGATQKGAPKKNQGFGGAAE
jgi:hypothetical protein